MIKNIIEVLIILIVSTSVNFNKKVSLVEAKMNLFYKGIENSSMSFILNNEVYLIFDYEFINEMASVVFKDYDVYIDKVNDSHFVITVFVEEKFLNKKIKEEIYLKKGDLYD